VSVLYIPLVGLPILLQENRWTEPNVGICSNDRSQPHESGIGTEAAQFLFWEYIKNRNFFAMHRHCLSTQVPFFCLLFVLPEIIFILYYFGLEGLEVNVVTYCHSMRHHPVNSKSQKLRWKSPDAHSCGELCT
jgi:hypothetical protein